MEDGLGISLDKIPGTHSPTDEPRMSSLDIAKITGKANKNLMQSIRTMKPAWEKINGLKFQLVNYTDKQINAIFCKSTYKSNFFTYKIGRNTAETRKVFDNAFRDGQVRTTGTDIDKILPAMLFTEKWLPPKNATKNATNSRNYLSFNILHSDPLATNMRLNATKCDYFFGKEANDILLCEVSKAFLARKRGLHSFFLDKKERSKKESGLDAKGLKRRQPLLKYMKRRPSAVERHVLFHASSIIFSSRPLA